MKMNKEQSIQTLKSRAKVIAGVIGKMMQNRLTLSGLTVLATLILVAIFAPIIAPYEPNAQHAIPEGLTTPLPPLSRGANGEFFLLGTDTLGRDVLSRLIWGTRPIMTIVVGTTAIASLIGIPIGAVAAYYGGLIDEILMRMMDVLISFPAVIMGIMILGVLGIEPIDVFGLFTIPYLGILILVIGLIWIPRFARVMRGTVLTEMQEGYVDALRVAGAPNRHILFKQVSVNAVGPLLVQATLSMSLAVLVGAALSFLGIGVQPPQASWGRMLAESRDLIYAGIWWLAILPGVLIMISSLAFNLVGDGIDDMIGRSSTDRGDNLEAR